jgi:VanZ family protein
MHPFSKQATWRGRFFRYAPLLLWIGVIFLLSGGLGAASNTSLIIRPLLLWLFPDITEPSIREVQFLVRKVAHFTEYGILACWALRAFKNSSVAVLKDRRFLFSLLLVIVIAAADEFNQGFIASRTSSPYDSLLDIAGGLSALIFVWLFWRKKPGQSPHP